MSDPGAADPLQEMRRYFAGRLPARIAELAATRDAAGTAGWAGEPLRTFHRLAHSLAGAGATFGFPAVSELAGRLEHRLKAVLAGGPAPTDAEVAEVDDLLVRLRAVAAQG